MEKLNDRQVLPNFYCEADDLLYFPPAVLARLVSVEMLNLSDKINQLQKEVGWSIAEMNDSIKSLSAKAANSHSSRTAMTSPPATASKNDLARRANIVVFEVPESQSIVQDKNTIDKILSCAVGGDVPVVDAFRLGKQKHPTTDQSVESNSESRPMQTSIGQIRVCLGLQSCAACKHKLRDFEGGKYFVQADMSADEQAKRKKHWMDRKQTPAQNQ